jgi:hypothetical protein
MLEAEISPRLIALASFQAIWLNIGEDSSDIQPLHSEWLAQVSYQR